MFNTPSLQTLRRYASQQATPKRNRAVPTLAFFIFINAFAAYTHFDDEMYFYRYPFPFAVDMGMGPSMLPTMDVQGSLYLRDCWSNRLVWLDWDHLKQCMDEWVSQQSTRASLRRPWQRGDVVTIYNPHTNALVTKRIVGVAGDTVKVFGEYAAEYCAAEGAYGDEGSYGVPKDPRFPNPFCQRILSKTENATNAIGRRLQSVHETAIEVPPNHVWVEGDNPLWSTDSRHFGPLPESALRGRVVLRLWPMSPMQILSSQRPTPFMNNDWMRDGKYGMKENGNSESKGNG